MIGRQASGMKSDNGIGGVENKGPLSKAKRRILKFANHAMKNGDVAPRCIVFRLRGRNIKRIEIGSMVRNLMVPLGMNLAMV